MKIITNTKHSGELCYVQVRDILFLAELTGNVNLMNQYYNLINEGKTDEEFVRIFQKAYIDIYKRCDFIIDFCEFCGEDVSINYISRLMVNMNVFIRNKNDRKFINHKSDDLRDIIAFKNGVLNYKIPLIVDGRFEVFNDDKSLSLNSTILKDHFVIKSTDGLDIKSKDYYDFYLGCINRIFDIFYPNIDISDRKFTVIENGSILIIRIDNILKKKNNSGIKVLGKRKKEVK
ncbi:MAG: hypothetical protein ACI4XM_08625 [Candidatus Coprovivens sp.]